MDNEQSVGVAETGSESEPGRATFGEKQNVSGAKSVSPPPKGKGGKKKHKAAKRIIAITAVVVVLAAGTFTVLRLTKKTTTQTTLTEAKVTRGNIEDTITGSGPVQPVQQYSVVPTVTGEILTDNITEGQKINKGDLLYTIDPTNANNAISQDENALQRAQLSYKQSADTLQNLTVVSDVSGVVTKVSVKNGDQVNANSPIVEVQDTANLLLTLPFNTADVNNMYVGEDAVVTLEASGTQLTGSVSRIGTGAQANNGSLTTNVKISFKNPGVVLSGDVATAVVGGQYACNASGTIAYNADETITAQTAGQVTGFGLQVGDSVTSGSVIATLKSDTASISAQTAQLQVQNAELALQNAKDALKNYNLTSPISGTVIEKNSKAGDTIGNTTSTTSMAMIADMSSLVLNIDVDELDIMNIKVGQSATITADALPGQTFTGKVTSVSTVGNSSSSSSSLSSGTSTGVTTYTVEITISDYGSLLPGMNVNASIVTSSASNVLLVPEQAIVNGGFVLKKTDSGTSPATSSGSETSARPSGSGQNNGGKSGPSGTGTSSGGTNPSGSSSGTGSAASPNSAGYQNRLKALQASAPKGYEYVRVTVGLTNSAFAEIKSGLSEGDTVAYKTKTATAAATSTTSTTSMGGLGGLGGNANRPAGGYGGNAGGGTAYRATGSGASSVTRSGGGSSGAAGRG